MNRVTESECVLDPTIVSQLMKSREPSAPLNRLSAREMDTLALLAEGRSNTGIADRLGVSERTVESLCAQVFRKLDLIPDADSNQRGVGCADSFTQVTQPGGKFLLQRAGVGLNGTSPAARCFTTASPCPEVPLARLWDRAA